MEDEYQRQKIQCAMLLVLDPFTVEKFLENMSDKERKRFLDVLEAEKETAIVQMGHPDQIVENIKSHITFDAIRFIEAMKYVIETSLDLQELITRAQSGGVLSKTEVSVLKHYNFGQETFDFSEEDFIACGGFSSPDFLRNLVDRIKGEYHVLIPLSDDQLTIHKQSGKEK